MLGTYHLNALFEILNKIHFVYEPKKLWSFVLEQACKTVQAEAGTFFEVSQDEKKLKVNTAIGISEDRLKEIPFVASQPQPTRLINGLAISHQAKALPSLRMTRIPPPPYQAKSRHTVLHS